MTFDKNSGLVKVWVSLIRDNIYKLEQCPKLYNLSEIVNEELQNIEKNKINTKEGELNG